MTSLSDSFASVCLKCLTFGSSGLYLLYALLILLMGLTAPSPLPNTTLPNQEGRKGHILLGGLGTISFPKLHQPSILAKLYSHSLHFFSPSSFLSILQFFVHSIRWALGLTTKGFNYWSVFKRLCVFYFLVIPLPAAFMPPVGHEQAAPDANLLVAIILLILVNAVGDLISARITIYNFQKLIDTCRARSAPTRNELRQGVMFEIRAYGTAIIDTLAALLVLCFVLMGSSILFGVQIGQYRFSFDSHTLDQMWDRALRFPELMSELYWFRDAGNTEDPSFGIPGMFIYGISTFIPTLIVLVFSIIWTITIPMRIVLQLPKSNLYRIISAEASVLAICTFLTYAFTINLPNLYSFLTTIWTT